MIFARVMNELSVHNKEERTEAETPQVRVALEGVSKKFRRSTLRKSDYTTIKTSLLARLLGGKKPKAKTICALDTISVEVRSGRSIGVIGRNGSGKSTMLKLIAGIYRADSGRISINGRVSALIELGAGFHPDFTGRENVYLGGIMYGLTRSEIDERFDKIVRYAELEEFIDDPVRTYSSGMYMRLGFSLAVHTEPDILLVDEVLAVGDAAFIHRCHDTISEFRRQGKTLILVTHDLNSVARWCDEAIWLEKGVVQGRGAPRQIIDNYLQAIEKKESEELKSENIARSSSEMEESKAVEEEEAFDPSGMEESSRWGNKDVELTGVRMLNSAGQAAWLFHAGEQVRVEVDYKIKRPIKELVFGIALLRADGLTVHGTNTEIEDVIVPMPDSGESAAGLPLTGTCSYTIPRLQLLEDTYFLDVAAHKSDGTPYDYQHRLHKFSVRSQYKHHGVYCPEHEWSFAVDYPVLKNNEKINQAAAVK